MNDPIEDKSAQLGRRPDSGLTGKFPIGAGFFCFLFLVSLLLSTCDMLGGSISKFIDYNTGEPRATFAGTVFNTQLMTRDGLMLNPDSDTGIIEFTVDIDNPEKYDLDITPEISQCSRIVGDSIDPKLFPISSQYNGNSITITIGNSAEQVHQGDSFNVILNMKTKDGKRVFKPYEGIPRIIFDSPLKFTKPAVISGPVANKYVATFSMQAPAVHAGICQIFVTFTSIYNGNMFSFEFDGEGLTWEQANSGSGETAELSVTSDYPHGSIDCAIPFPYDLTGHSQDELDESYKVLVTLWDKNGINVKSGEGGTPETYLNNLHISYLERDTSDYVDSGWVFNKDRQRYTLLVPYSVERVEFRAETNPDIPGGGVQEVHWGTSVTSELVKSFPLGPGQNDIPMSVIWKSPTTDQDDLALSYTFSITRVEPKMNSTLSKLIVEGLDSSSSVVTSFETASGITVPLHTTVYVPPSVTKIKILGDYLSTSLIYNDKGLDTSGLHANVLPNIYSPSKQIDGPLQYGDYYSFNTEPNDDLTYLAKDPLYIWENGWQYIESPTGESLVNAGVYTFYFYVKSESDLYGASSQCYTITVIKTDATGNPNAKINKLTLTGADPSHPLLDNTDSLAPYKSAYDFDPDITSYTVDFPSSTGSLSLHVEPLAEAEIREITCVDSANNPIPGFSYIPPITGPATLSIPSIPAKARLTLTVYTGASPTPKNYTIDLIRRSASWVITPQLTSGGGNLKVTWSQSYPSSTTYEIRYSPWSTNSTVPEKAWKLGGVVSSGVIIAGLTNYQQYCVWGRAVDNNGNPGNWTVADTSGNKGIPGPAELTGLGITVKSDTSSDLTGVLDPSAFSSSVYNYTLTVPYNTGTVTFTPQKASGNPYSYSNVNGSVPSQQGYSSLTTVNAYTPDGLTSQPYKITVIRKLATPVLNTPVEQSGSIQLSWAAITNAASYEVSYKTHGGSDTRVLEIPAVASPTVTIQGLTNGAPGYDVWVRAKRQDAAVGSVYSDDSAVKTATPANYYPSNLAVDSGTLRPVFDPAVTSYWVDVPYSASTITVTPTAPAGTAITGDGVKSLVVGTNPAITVTATPPGSPARTYTIYVTRDAGLDSLSVDSGTLSPSFSSGVTDYTVSGTVLYGTSSINVSYVKPSGATVTGAGGCPLAVGSNTINVKVSQNGMEKVYTITVNRGEASTTNTLSGITLYDGDNTMLNQYVPPLSDTLTLSVSDSVDKIIVDATPSDTHAAGVYVFGGDDLLVGSNYIYVQVIPESGISGSKVYTIIVDRAAP